MIWLKSHTERIRRLMSLGDLQSLTYAALEARLAIEAVCYDRLRNAHDYISNDDLRGWQPAKVVQVLISDVDEHIASDYTLSIGDGPVSDFSKTEDDYQRHNYLPVGRQVGFDAKKLGRMWNALGSFLHVRLPESKAEAIEIYGTSETVTRRLEEVLAELDRLASGTLIGSGFGQEISFTCECGTVNRRRAKLLHHGRLLNCINSKCQEQWIVELQDDEIWFHRKTIMVNCFACKEEHVFPANELMRMDTDHEWRFDCRCGETNRVRWRLCYAKPPQWRPDSRDAQAQQPVALPKEG